MQINIQNLSKSYKQIKALDPINLKLESPSVIGLVGQNGAGKSTLMKLMVAQIKATSGKITIDGKNLSQCENDLKKRLGYLPQDFGLYDELTVTEFLDYMACIKGIHTDRKKVVQQTIAEVSLEEKKRSKIKTLSGGQKQRVGIAQAILNDPELLIVDEPTVGLDPEERIKFRNLFSHGAKDRIAILSTHIIEDVALVCNRLIVLHQGSILFDGEPSELVKRAVGHVGIIEAGAGHAVNPESLKIVATIITEKGAKYRMVGDLPSYAQVIEPT